MFHLLYLGQLRINYTVFATTFILGALTHVGACAEKMKEESTFILTYSYSIKAHNRIDSAYFIKVTALKNIIE